MKIAYFCTVTIFSHPVFKKATAVFIFGLLALVYAEKFFHAHERLMAQGCEGIHATDTYVHCTICDFQLAKAATVPEQTIASQIIPFYPVYQASKPGFYYFIPPACTTSRGPPAC